ncbi:MAG: hypothetical protein ABIH18_01225 [Candidatus Omnitrophota bacterium]
MKIIILIFIVVCLIFSTSEASWYVVDANNKVVVKCEYEPDTKDLQFRNETAVFSKEDISLQEARYHNGKITRRVKTPTEIAEENKKNDEEADRKIINEKLKAMAIEKLKSEGKVLKYYK